MDETGCVIAGIGNRFMTDDSVGLTIAAELRKHDLPPGIKVAECSTDEFNLLVEVENAEKVIIVDAVSSGKAPGTVTIFSPEETELVWNSCGNSLHTYGLAEAIALARALGVTARITVVGVEPQSVRPGGELTPLMASKLPAIVQAVLNLVDARNTA